MLTDQQQQTESCIWTYDGLCADYWSTECGEFFVLIDGATPTEDKMKFCPFCGRPIIEIVVEDAVD